MSIAEALSRSASASGMTDTQIGAAVGVSAATVGHWRKARKRPRGSHLIKLIEVVPGFGRLIGLEQTTAA